MEVTLLFLLVAVGVAAMVIASLKYVKCVSCGRQFKQRQPQQAQPEGSRAQPDVVDFFKPDTKRLTFCSDECQKKFEDEEVLICGWCKDRVLRKHSIKTKKEGFLFCTPRCLSEFEVARNAEEKRIRYEEK
jgi:YHS domain-containing protein